MNTLIKSLIEQAQQTTKPDEQLAVIILLLEDAVRRLQLPKGTEMNLIDEIDKTHKRVLELNEKLQQAHQEKMKKILNYLQTEYCPWLQNAIC